MPVRPLPFALTTACCLLLGACASTGTTATPQAGAPIAVQVPVVAHQGGETPAWWYRSGAAQAASRGASRCDSAAVGARSCNMRIAAPASQRSDCACAGVSWRGRTSVTHTVPITCPFG